MIGAALARFGSPLAVLVSAAAVAASLGLWWSGALVDGRAVRFAAVAFGTASLMTLVRLWLGASRRGGLADWGAWVATAPLPYFDDELGQSALRRLRTWRPVVGVSLLLSGAALAAVVATSLAMTPRSTGALDLAPGDSAEAWQQTAPQLEPRDFGFEVSVADLALNAPPAMTLAVADPRSGWSTERRLVPNERARLGDWTVRWAGVTIDRAIGGAVVAIGPRGGEATEMTLRVGASPVEIGNGETAQIVEVSRDRLGTFGPAVRVRIVRGDGEEVAWLHARDPDLHAERGGGDLELRLVELLPASRARLVVTPYLPSVFALGALAALGLFMLGVALLVSAPVWLRGRSGDYELVTLGLGGARRLPRAAERVLSREGYAECMEVWRRLGLGQEEKRT